MTAPDVTELQATIAELKAELSRVRVQAEVFRALYERQATEIDDLLAPTPGEDQPASRRRRFWVVAADTPVGIRPCSRVSKA